MDSLARQAHGVGYFALVAILVMFRNMGLLRQRSYCFREDTDQSVLACQGRLAPDGFIVGATHFRGCSVSTWHAAGSTLVLQGDGR